MPDQPQVEVRRVSLPSERSRCNLQPGNTPTKSFSTGIENKVLSLDTGYSRVDPGVDYSIRSLILCRE